MNKYTIGQVSNMVRLPTKTIRFYEEQNIISSAQRAENGYREYSEEAIEELTLIKYARDLGLPISEIKKLMVGCVDHKQCAHSRKNIMQTIDSYEGLLTEKIAEFQRLKSKLHTLKVQLNDPNKNACDEKRYCCNILGQLSEIDG